MTMNRRRFNQWVGAVSCLPVLQACKPTPATPVTIGIQVWPGYEPMLLAQSMGWITNQHAVFKETGSATESIDLLAKKQLDGAGLTLDEVIRARERGVDLTIIMVCDISAGADVFLARPDIATLADLKGKRIGTEDGALGELMLHEVLKAGKLTRADVTTVSLTIDKHEEAWKSGLVDAIATYEPAAGHITGMGAKNLFDSRAIPDLIMDVLAVRSELLDNQHSESLKTLVAAHQQALSYIQSNPDDAAYRLSQRFNLPAEQTLTVFRGLILADIHNNRRLLTRDTAAIKRSIAMVSETLLNAKILRAPPVLAGLYTADYLPPTQP